MIRTIYITLCLAFVAQAIGTASAADLNIIVFDRARAFVESKAGKDVQQQAQKLQGTVQEEAQALQDKFKSDRDKLEEQRNLIATDVFRDRAEKLRLEALQEQQKMSTEINSIQAGVVEAQRKVLEVAEKGLDKVAKARKADIIIGREALFFASPAVDVTSEVIAYMDKELSSVKVTPVKRDQ